jgi:hypothetical protein
MKGRKPKPTQLKVITGNPGRRPLNKAEPQPAGRPIKPQFLKGRPARLWIEYVDRAFWLTAAESHIFAAWCCLAVEFERDPDRMPAARIGQWRALTAELGLTPSSRSRLSVPPKPPASDPDDWRVSINGGPS